MSYLDSKRIVGTNTQRGTFADVAGGWKELGRSSGASQLDVSSLADKRYYMVLFHKPSGNAVYSLRLNADSGNNYSRRYSNNGGTDTTNTSQSSLFGNNLYFGNYNEFAVAYIANKSDKEKLGIFHAISGQTAGAGNAPSRIEIGSKWVNTSNAINRIQTQGTMTDANSEMVVLGWDPSDTHTTNFWEELADVSGTNATTLSSGTITAKKYLWIQLYCDGNTSGAPILRFNSDSGSNYARRYSNNGGADSTSTSEDAIYPYYQSNANPKFINMFVINNQSNEKLVISHTIEQNTAGAGNVPFRNELVGKWANTSNQITNITFTDISAGSYFGTSSFIKVWGSN